MSEAAVENYHPELPAGPEATPLEMGRVYDFVLEPVTDEPLPAPKIDFELVRAKLRDSKHLSPEDQAVAIARHAFDVCAEMIRADPTAFPSEEDLRPMYPIAYAMRIRPADRQAMLAHKELEEGTEPLKDVMPALSVAERIAKAESLYPQPAVAHTMIRMWLADLLGVDMSSDYEKIMRRYQRQQQRVGSRALHHWY